MVSNWVKPTEWVKWTTVVCSSMELAKKRIYPYPLTSFGRYKWGFIMILDLWWLSWFMSLTFHCWIYGTYRLVVSNITIWNHMWDLRENYRKTPYFIGKSMVSCKFSLKPIHWNQLWCLLFPRFHRGKSPTGPCCGRSRAAQRRSSSRQPWRRRRWGPGPLENRRPMAIDG